MQIVIDIPKDLYDQFKWREEEIRKHKKYVVYKAILDGAVLPKGCGRLIDADLLSGQYGLDNATKYGNKDADQQRNSYDTMMMYEIADMIDDAPTVVAADVEVEE